MTIPPFLDGRVRWPVKKQRANEKKHGDGVHTIPSYPECQSQSGAVRLKLHRIKDGSHCQAPSNTSSRAARHEAPGAA